MIAALALIGNWAPGHELGILLGALLYLILLVPAFYRLGGHGFDCRSEFRSNVAVVTGVLAGLAALMGIFSHLEQPAPIGSEAGSPAGITVVVGVALYTVVAPCIEEYLFRERLYSWIRARASAVVTILGTAAVFALSHIGQPIDHMVQLLIVGFVLGWAREVTNDLRVVTVAHGAYNLVAVVTLVGSIITLMLKLAIVICLLLNVRRLEVLLQRTDWRVRSEQTRGTEAG